VSVKWNGGDIYISSSILLPGASKEKGRKMRQNRGIKMAAPDTGRTGGDVRREKWGEFA
jgi:hypothetical protein